MGVPGKFMISFVPPLLFFFVLEGGDRVRLQFIQNSIFANENYVKIHCVDSWFICWFLAIFDVSLPYTIKLPRWILHSKWLTHNNSICLLSRNLLLPALGWWVFWRNRVHLLTDGSFFVIGLMPTNYALHKSCGSSGEYDFKHSPHQW